MARPCHCEQTSECRLCWLYHNDPRYQRLWDNQIPKSRCKRVRSHEPVGDYLAKVFEWLGQVKSGSCGCKKLQAKMNKWGVKGCRENYAIILDKLEKAAFERNLPVPRLAFIAPLELAIWRAKRHNPIK